MERYNDIRGIRLTPFNLTSIRSFSSPSPITMSTSCPLGIAFAVRPSAAADIPKWDFGFFTINMIGYQVQVIPAMLAAFTLVYKRPLIFSR